MKLPKMKYTPKVFLGGTCNNSDWRDKLIPKLDINYFNPVVKDWTPTAQEHEITQRETSDYCLYTITPKMTGVYSIAEVIDDSNKRPEKTILYIMFEDEDAKFTPEQVKSLDRVGQMVAGNGGLWAKSEKEVLDKLNN